MKITAHRPDMNQEYRNEFVENNIYPFAEIGRVVVDRTTGEIKKRCSYNDSNYDIDGNHIEFDSATEEMMVYIPAFYYKRTWNGDQLEDSILTEKPDSLSKYGYSVHPAFIKADGTIRDYFLIGAFIGVYKDNQLRSVPSLEKPKVSVNITSFREAARRNRSINWNLFNFLQLSALQILYKVGFQNLHSQNIIGDGWTKQSASATVGTTMGIGNRSGYSEQNGNQISIFGIEDFYGNVWQWIDGFLLTDDGYYITGDANNFGQLESHDFIQTTVPASQGYVKQMTKIDGKYDCVNIPGVFGGGQDTYYCDSFWAHKATQTNVCALGGNWSNSSAAGCWYLSCSYVASVAYAYNGARLCWFEN